MPNVTIDWLNNHAKILVRKHWGLNHIPEIVIDLDRDSLDWDNYVGYYCSDIETIVFSSQVNARKTERAIKRTLLHELVHWYLHTTGQKFLDSDARFARELIRVGLGRRHNPDDQSVLAAKEAWKQKKEERFEIIEKNADETIIFRLRHHRKNQDDFKKDLALTLIRMHNNKINDDSEYKIMPEDVAEMICEWYGYKLDPVAVYGIVISSNDRWGSGDVGDRDDIISVLDELGVDEEEAERKLLELRKESLSASSNFD